GLIVAVTDTGTPVITGYEIGAGGNGAAFPSSPSLQSAPLMRKEQIVAALKERIAQLEAQVNGTDSVEAVEFNEKSPAVKWVAASMKEEGHIRPAGDVHSLAQRVENFNASDMRAVLDPQTKEPVAGVVERFQKERGEDAPQFSRAAAASFGTITPEQEAGFFRRATKPRFAGFFVGCRVRGIAGESALCLRAGGLWGAGIMLGSGARVAVLRQGVKTDVCAESGDGRGKRLREDRTANR
ncbi:MAG: hypothetical protein J5820_00030, partial [Rhodocyclaceae bacterium]|nr:hypothetical protein [Rhodocyclaceae bacterium]